MLEGNSSSRLVAFGEKMKVKKMASPSYTPLDSHPIHSLRISKYVLLGELRLKLCARAMYKLGKP